MQRKKTHWILAAALSPVLVGAAVVACGGGDGDDDPTPGTGGTGGTAASMGGAGGTVAGTGGTGGTPAGTGGSGGGGGCAAEVAVMADVTTSTTWNCPKYVLKKRIFVTNNATLTIAAGTQILGETSGSEKTALLVARGSKLVAVGTKDKPIVFTSANPPGARTSGDWAGVALLGNASLNSGSCQKDGNPATTDACEAPGYFEGSLEGIEVTEAKGKFGGADDASNCGHLEYVRIEFAGAELSPDNELNGLTLAGCGTGTKVSHVQVHRGKDDGVELFGGTANLDHLVLTGNADDSLDFDLGWRGKLQHLVVQQYEGQGDAAIEASSFKGKETAEPRTNPTIFNATLIGTRTTTAIIMKEGLRGVYRNFIVQGFGGDVVDFQSKSVDLAMEVPAQLSLENSLFWMNGAFKDETGFDTTGGAMVSRDDDKGFNDQMAVEDPARKNKKDVDPMLTSTNPAAPNFVPKNAAVGGQASPTFGDTTASYAGALKPNDPMPWTDGWTAYPNN